MLSDFEDSDSESNQNVNTSQRLKDFSKRSTVSRSRSVEKPFRVVHNDLFSDSDDDDDTPKYDVYSLARLFQGQVTENFRSLNAHILDPVVADTEEVDNELYCLCRYTSKT